MNTNVARRVKHYRLSKVKGYYAIFEAISNSIDSFNTIDINSLITVEFYRDNNDLDLGFDIHEKLYREVRIIDNGIGFNDANFNSFNTSDSDFKENLGGKGLGRFSWLKVFEKVKIESNYFQDDEFYHRSFEFIRTAEGIANDKVTSATKNSTGTTIYLYKQNKEWSIPKKIQTFAEKLIEHFLPHFLDKVQPVIILKDIDSGEEINVNNYFKKNYNGLMGESTISIKKHDFKISVHKTKIGSSNQLIYLANKRASKILNLAKTIINLNADLYENGDKYYIIAFVSGTYLDDSVTPERDEFAFDETETSDEINLQEINTSVCAEINKIIKSIIDNIIIEKKKKVDEFLAKEGPEYRYLVNKNPNIIDYISPIASANEIEQHLHKAEVIYKEETTRQVKEILAKEDLNEEDIEDAYFKVSDAAKADLTKYILWRDHVIALLNKKLAWDETNKYKTESTLHKLFYQMKRTSDDVPYETNNLWLIDERLNFHDYLASDLPIDNAKGDRPDILTVNTAYYFNNEDNPGESFSIIEFKRPMRDDYTDEKNPIDQVINYIQNIRLGNALRRDGTQIVIQANTPCFAYIICQITSNLKLLCDKKEFSQTYDNMGYFRYHSKLNAYIEIMSFQKIAKEAKNRNRIFMKKIGLT